MSEAVIHCWVRRVAHRGSCSRARALHAFELRDVTNLTTPDDAHLTRLTLELAEPQRLIVTETYLESGKPDATTLAFTRR